MPHDKSLFGSEVPEIASEVPNMHDEVPKLPCEVPRTRRDVSVWGDDETTMTGAYPSLPRNHPTWPGEKARAAGEIPPMPNEVVQSVAE